MKYKVYVINDLLNKTKPERVVNTVKIKKPEIDDNFLVKIEYDKVEIERFVNVKHIDNNILFCDIVGGVFYESDKKTN